MRHRCLFAIASICLTGISSVTADTAVDADPFGPASFILNAGRTGGWRFTVDAPLELTHIGLYDWGADGFQADYPIGIWSENGTLLNTIVMPAGSGAPLVNGFRYLDAPGPSVVFSPGQTYTIGYFASAIFPNDRMLHEAGSHQLHPLVHQVGPAVSSDGAFPNMVMPATSFTEHWFGPSFQFVVVPGPASWMLIGLLGLRISRRRR
jgi:hypothetical protein